MLYITYTTIAIQQRMPSNLHKVTERLISIWRLISKRVHQEKKQQKAILSLIGFLCIPPSMFYESTQEFLSSFSGKIARQVARKSDTMSVWVVTCWPFVVGYPIWKYCHHMLSQLHGEHCNAMLACILCSGTKIIPTCLSTSIIWYKNHIRNNTCWYRPHIKNIMFLALSSRNGGKVLIFNMLEEKHCT